MGDQVPNSIAISTLAFTLYNLITIAPTTGATLEQLFVEAEKHHPGATRSELNAALAELVARQYITVGASDTYATRDPMKRLLRMRRPGGTGWEGWMVKDSKLGKLIAIEHAIAQ